MRKVNKSLIGEIEKHLLAVGIQEGFMEEVAFRLSLGGCGQRDDV